MVEMPEALKEIVLDVVKKPIVIIIGVASAAALTSTFGSGLLIGRWYGSRKIREYNNREDLYPKRGIDWSKISDKTDRLKFWKRKPKVEHAVSSESVSINKPAVSLVKEEC